MLNICKTFIRQRVPWAARFINATKLILILNIHRIVPRRLADVVYRACARISPPSHWKRVGEIIAAIRFAEGSLLLDDNRPKAAWQAFERCLATSSEPFHYFVAAICSLVGMGQYQNGLALFTRANGLRREKAKAYGLEGSRIRFLDAVWVGSIGHTAQTDYLIKLSILEGRSPDETIIYLPPGVKIANQYLLDQWRPYYRVVEDPANLPMPLDALNSLAFDILAPRLPDGSTEHLWKIAAETYRRWYAQDRGPLLAISADVEDRARFMMSSVGIPKDAWFVALHVREAKSNVHHASLHDSLNADIFDYIPAINEIVRRGGWVIRIGDPTMKPLPPSANVFDYSHSTIRSDWIDIYLLAKCQFLLGTSSGPAYVPPIYGVPSVLTNWWPPAQKPWHPQDIFVPKRVRIGQKQHLTLAQSLEEPFGYCNSLYYLDTERNAVVESNSPAEISGAVIEMFEQLKTTAGDTDEDTALRQRADQIYESFDIRGMSRLSRDFLRRHKGFVD
jgi:putative glycosyltransferase (TIGR04372 family)